MIQTINLSQFRSAFYNMDRKENFSYEGLEALFDYLESYEDDTGEKIELDVIALCCDYTEFESLEDFQAQYSKDYESIDDIKDETTVIMIDDERFIIQNF